MPVADITAALEFYCVSLGFDLGWKAGDPATHANVCRDDIDITLVLNPSGVGSGNVYVYTSGVDGYHSQLSTREVEVGALENRDYGMRDFLVRDPFGNRLVFGQPSV
jgi:catechol 2,3-dioxygenase-like lactoylglutathione lyase family enzyme